jgi:hypothetical protein
VCTVVFHASPELNPVNLRFPQNRPRIFHTHKIEQQIGREITAAADHCVRKRGDLRGPSNSRVQLRRRVAILADAKDRSVCCAEETVSHV